MLQLLNCDLPGERSQITFFVSLCIIYYIAFSRMRIRSHLFTQESYKACSCSLFPLLFYCKSISIFSFAFFNRKKVQIAIVRCFTTCIIRVFVWFVVLLFLHSVSIVIIIVVCFVLRVFVHFYLILNDYCYYDWRIFLLVCISPTQYFKHIAFTVGQKPPIDRSEMQERSHKKVCARDKIDFRCVDQEFIFFPSFSLLYLHICGRKMLLKAKRWRNFEKRHKHERHKHNQQRIPFGDYTIYYNNNIGV